jgi:hypothetical protein
MPSACGWVISKRVDALAPEVLHAMSRTLQHANKTLGDPTVAVLPFGESTFFDVASPPFPRHIAFEHPATDDCELARALACPVWQVCTMGRGVHVLQWAADGTLIRAWEPTERAQLVKTSGIAFTKLPKRTKGALVYELQPDAALARLGDIEAKRKSIESWESAMRFGNDDGQGPAILSELRAELAELEKG